MAMSSRGKIIALSIAAAPSIVTVAAAFCSLLMKVSHMAIATESTLTAAPPAIILVMRYLGMCELLHREHAEFRAACHYRRHATARDV